MQSYLVSSVALPMVGIESCRILIVSAAQEAAFLQQYAGRIVQAGCQVAAWPQVPVSRWRRASSSGGRQRRLPHLPVTYGI